MQHRTMFRLNAPVFQEKKGSESTDPIKTGYDSDVPPQPKPKPEKEA